MIIFPIFYTILCVLAVASALLTTHPSTFAAVIWPINALIFCWAWFYLLKTRL